MKKTLLLCFIHGFKGGDDTFGEFPEHLRALVSHGLPKIDVRAIQYPQFETRGDLAECVSRFRDWLQEKVIDIEVSNGTPSPTVEPSVRTILIGHSMGGIVAADTLIALTSDTPIDSPDDQHLNGSMFPYVQGVLAFDTPYLGISPGVVAHGAEGHYNTASAALSSISAVSGLIWGNDEKDEEKNIKNKKPVAVLPPPPQTDTNMPVWQRWGKYAMYAGAAGAVAAAGGAAYMKRDQITSGWTWVGSHLEFVGCLMKPAELERRMTKILRVRQELDIGYANLYTRLGRSAINQEGSMVGKVIGNTRTFCNLPKKEARVYFHEAINDAAKDETGAHMTMFFPKDNPGYYAMSEEAKTHIVEWTSNEWYESSTGETIQLAIEHAEL